MSKFILTSPYISLDIHKFSDGMYLDEDPILSQDFNDKISKKYRIKFKNNDDYDDFFYSLSLCDQFILLNHDIFLLKIKTVSLDVILSNLSNISYKTLKRICKTRYLNNIMIEYDHYSNNETNGYSFDYPYNDAIDNCNKISFKKLKFLIKKFNIVYDKIHDTKNKSIFNRNILLINIRNNSNEKEIIKIFDITITNININNIISYYMLWNAVIVNKINLFIHILNYISLNEYETNLDYYLMHFQYWLIGRCVNGHIYFKLIENKLNNNVKLFNLLKNYDREIAYLKSSSKTIKIIINNCINLFNDNIYYDIYINHLMNLIDDYVNHQLNYCQFNSTYYLPISYIIFKYSIGFDNIDKSMKHTIDNKMKQINHSLRYDIDYSKY